MRNYEEQARKPLLETNDNGFKIVLPNQNINGSITDIDFNDKNVAIMNLFMKQSIIQWRDVETTFGLFLAMAGRLLHGPVDKELFVLLTAGTKQGIRRVHKRHTGNKVIQNDIRINCVKYKE